MKVRLLFVRNSAIQYGGKEEDYAMEKQCKTVEVVLPLTNDDARKDSSIGEWQIVGYEEINE